MADNLIAREIDNLTHTGTVKDCITEHSKLCIQASPTLNANRPDACQMLMRRIKPYLYKINDMGCCCTMTDTYTKACNAEDKNRVSNRASQLSKDDKSSRWGN